MQDHPAPTYIGEYSEHGPLGDGGQAEVYLVRKGVNFFAAKVYHQGNSKKKSFEQEVRFLEKLNFKHLINMVKYDPEAKVKLPLKPETTRPVIILECAQDELFDYIAKCGRFPADICRYLTKCIISAIEYLHEMGVTHRDLKPENILFDKDYVLKVSDFGLSTLLEGQDGDGFLYTMIGTDGYRPPELELGQKYTGAQTDLFALGVIIFVMYSGNPPFLSAKPNDKVYNLIKEKKYSSFWKVHEKRKPAGFYSPSFKKMMNSFFSANPEERPTLESLKTEEWLNEDIAMHNDVTEELTKRHQKLLEIEDKKRQVEEERLRILQSL